MFIDTADAATKLHIFNYLVKDLCVGVDSSCKIYSKNRYANNFSKEAELIKKSLCLSVIIMISFLCCTYVQELHAQMPYIDGELHYSRSGITTLRVIGRGIEPERARTRAEAILMAERAAVADGYRQLTEKVHGVYLDSQSYTRNGSTIYALQQQETQAWLRGAEVTQINRLSNGITEAELILHLNSCNGCGCGCNRGCRSYRCNRNSRSYDCNRNCRHHGRNSSFFGFGFKVDNNYCK